MNWLRVAEEELDRIQRRLPPDLLAVAQQVPVFLEELPDPLEEDLLGLFEGASKLDPPPDDPEDLPRITIYCATIASQADSDPVRFRKELQTTYLHELGHFLGWDEDEIALRGLA